MSTLPIGTLMKRAMTKPRVNLQQLRQRAESALKQQGEWLREEAIASDPESVRWLLEELRLYQAELELQNQELLQSQTQTTLHLARYRQLFLQMPLPALVVDSRGVLIELNRQARQLFNISALASLQQQPVLQLFEHDSREQLYELLRFSALTPSSQPRSVGPLELRSQRHQRGRWVDVHLMPLSARELESGQLLLLLVDKSAEVAQKEATRRFESMANHVPGVLYQYQQWPDGRTAFPYASKAMESIYGLSPQQVMSDAAAVFKLLHPDDLMRVVESITASMTQLTLWRDTYRINRVGGDTIWVEGEATPERMADGSTLWHGYIRRLASETKSVGGNDGAA
ncbi:PAS domain S-box protein [Ectothiorhodospiraceae bacterium BW-2]|nr:PAS domain S-box protein [Ectothiorhodospiraceae bacterium BW-2]